MARGKGAQCWTDVRALVSSWRWQSSCRSLHPHLLVWSGGAVKHIQLSTPTHSAPKFMKDSKPPGRALRRLERHRRAKQF